MRRISTLKSFIALFLLSFTCKAFAAIPDSGLLNDVTDRFLAQSVTWGSVITNYATWLFWLLATISMVWTFGLMALRKADIGEFYAEFIRFTVTTGFFWWLLSNGPAMAMAIINSLRTIGAQAGGLPNTLSPSTPISIGFDIVKKAFTGLSWVHPIDNLGIVLVSASLVIAMAVVAANVLIALVTAWVMAYAGVFILGFGGARWTSDMAIGYFKAMLGIGLELMTMTLLVAIAVSVIDGFYQALDGSSVYELLLVLCVCVVLSVLINKIPARVAGLVGGGSGAGVGAGAVMGAAAMAAAAAATGGAALAAGAASMAGGAQALMAAFSKANASESGGSSGGLGAVMNAAGGGSTDSPMAGGGNSGGASGSGSALAAAMGDSGSSKSGPTASSSSPAGGASSLSSNSSGGTDSKAEAAATGGKGAESATNDGGSQKEAKPGGAKSAAGAVAAKIGKVAAGTAVNLAQGSWDVAKAKASELKESAMDRIGETTGGKIAAAIKARDAAARAGGNTAQFDHDSLSASSKSVDAESEIAAFRDRKSITS